MLVSPSSTTASLASQGKRHPTKLNNSTYYYYTPFGAFCNLCQEPVGDRNVSANSLKEHHYRKHANNNIDSNSQLSFEFLAKLIKEKTMVLVNNTLQRDWVYDDTSRMITTWKCRTCNKQFKNKPGVKKHIKSTKHGSIDNYTNNRSFNTVCNRLVSFDELKEYCWNQNYSVTRSVMNSNLADAQLNYFNNNRYGETPAHVHLLPNGGSLSSLSSSSLNYNFKIDDFMKQHKMIPNVEKYMLTTVKDINHFLRKYKNDDEETDIYAEKFKSWSTQYDSLEEFDGALKENVTYLENIRKEDSNDDCLDIMLGSINLFVNEYSREHVNILPANVRYRVLSFNYTEDNNLSANNCFKMRDRTNDILTETNLIIKYFWKYGDLISPELKNKTRQEIASEQAKEHATEPVHIDNLYRKVLCLGIPHKVILSIVSEHLDTSFQLLFGIRFAITRLMCIKGENSDKLIMRSCGEFGKILSTQLHVYRLFVCSWIAMHHSNSWDEILLRLNNSTLIHTISPLIRSTKIMQGKKVSRRTKILHENGDITVDNILFTKRVWRNLVQILYTRFVDMFSLLFEDKVLKIFFDCDCQVNMSCIDCRPQETETDKPSNEYSYAFCYGLSQDSLVSSQSITIKENISDTDITNTTNDLSSLIVITLQGTGLGAPRLNEIFRIKSHQTKYANRWFYYSTYTRKRATVSSTNVKAIEHKIPSELSKAMLLYDRLMCILKRDRELFVSFSKNVGENQKYDEATVQESNMVRYQFQSIFQMRNHKVDSLTMRHFYISLNDYIFSTDASLMSSSIIIDENLASMSGHSISTHEKFYSTEFKNNVEENYNTYHSAIGAKNHVRSIASEGASKLPKRLDNSTLLSALQHLFNNNNARFFNNLQKEMLEDATNNFTKHTFAILGCGSGKSLITWKIPFIARKIDRVPSGTVIVVLPYCFLMDFHIQDTNVRMNLLGNYNSVGLKGCDIKREQLPTFLDDKSSSVKMDIIFLSIEALNNLFEYHLPLLRKWIDQNHVSKIIVDEIHVLLTEINFRSSFDVIRKIGTLQTPTIYLSGTIPKRFIRSLGNYFISNDKGDSCNDFLDEHNTLIDTNILGNKYVKIEVTKVKKSYLSVCCNYIRERVRDCSGAIHIICSTTNEVETMYKMVKKFESSVSYIHSSSNNQKQVASQWKSKRLRILISSTIGIVGNENENTNTVIIVGLLYDLLAVVQCCGRIRPHRRNEQSCVHIFLPAETKHIVREQNKTEKLHFNQLSTLGILKNSDNEDYLQCLTSESVMSWINNTSICRVIGLGKCLGYNLKRCNICDICIGTEIGKVAVNTTQQLDYENTTKEQGIAVLQLLRQKCIVCNRKNCNGGCNVRPGYCFKCNGKHSTKDCLKEYIPMFKNKCCYNCYCLFDGETKRHTFQWCININNSGYKERIRALLFDHFNANSSSGHRSFVNVIEKIYANKQSYFSFLAGYYKKDMK